MTKMGPSLGGGTDKERRVHLALSLHRYVAEIETILSQLEAGEFGELGQLPKLKREMMSVSKQLRDAEIEFDQQCRADAGVRGDGDIDFDAIREQIGGRLDSLRAARRSGAISE